MKKVKKKELKCCNYFGVCKYKTVGGIFLECKYDGYCDYQVPRDSRREANDEN